MICAARLKLVIVAFSLLSALSWALDEAPAALAKPQILARVSKPNLALRFVPLGQDLLVMGQGSFWRVPMNQESALVLSPHKDWGSHYWGFSLVAADSRSALACVDGGNRLLSIQLQNSNRAPVVREHVFDEKRADSCGGVAVGSTPDQVWVAGLQNHTLIELKKTSRSFSVVQRKQGYVGAFLHLLYKNYWVGLWGTLSPDHFGAFVFDPKQQSLLLSPSSEGRRSRYSSTRTFADDIATAGSGVYFVEPHHQQLVELKLNPQAPVSERLFLNRYKTQIQYPYQVESAGRCALVAGLQEGSNAQVIEWILPATSFRKLVELPSHNEATGPLRYLALSESGRLFGSDSIALVEYKDFKVPAECEFQAR
jgi:hypothetical protein